MGTYTGTDARNTITPETISAGVTRIPAGSRPSAGADTINGLGGNDMLDGGRGGDIVNGGAGADTIRDGYDEDGYRNRGPANAGNVIHGDAGNDDIRIHAYDTGGANPVSNVAYGDDGNDTVRLEIGDYAYVVEDDLSWTGDRPTGTVALYGDAGNDDLGVTSYVLTPGMTVNQYGGAGNDTLGATIWVWEPDGSYSGGNNTDRLYGGTGDDTYWVAESKDLVIENPGEGVDTVKAVDMDYVLPANVENLLMTFYYYPYEDVYVGTGNALNNVITVDEYAWEWSSYHLNGMGGNDVIHGSPLGDDIIDGGAGNDTLYGGPSDAWSDGLNNDVIRGGTGDDLIYGGGGNGDRQDGDDRLYGDDGNDRIFGSYGDDRMYGGTGNDEMGGQAGNDTMFGGAGNDTLGGGTGDDTLNGDGGNDRIAGREGADTLSGGSGNDVFDYYAATDSRSTARDVILDFDGVGAAVGDRIDLSNIDANTSDGGNQAFAFRGTGAFTGAGQVRVLASGADTLIQANTGGTLAPELEILVKDGAALPGQWVAADFVL